MTRSLPALKHLLWPICIALVVAAATRERVQAYAAKSCIRHDEVIALMAASCHEGDYERARFDLSNRWTPAARWKALLTTDQLACFGRIRSDLVRYDIHPPLFFWLLHLSGIIGGFGPTTGARLNTIVHAISLLGLMVLARRLTGTVWVAVAAGALWSFSAVGFDTTFYARQYELLGCLGVLSVLAVHATLTAEARPRLRAAGVACALAGMTLTQWYGVVGSIYVGVVVLVLAAIERRRTLDGLAPSGVAARFRLLAGAWVAAQGVTLIAHPRIVGHFLETSGQPFDSGTPASLLARLRSTLQTLGGFFGFQHGERGKALVFILLALFIAVAAVPAWQWTRVRRATRPEELERVLPAACAALAIPLFAAVVTVPFLARIGSGHAMSPRYLSLLWPIWALGLAWAFCAGASRVGAARPRLALASMGALGVVAWSYHHRKAAAEQSAALCSGDTNVSLTLPLVHAVITDNTHRGTFGQSIPFIRDDALVFAFPTLPGAVPERPPPPAVDGAALVRGLRHEGAVSIFHHPAYGISPTAADDIRHALGAAGLDLAQMSEWPFALPGMVVLITYNSSSPGRGPNDALEQLERRGSAMTGFGGVEGYAAVMFGGKLEKEDISREGDATLAAADVALPIEDFEIVSGSKRSWITLGRYRYDNPHPGFLVMLYDPAQRRIVYRMGFPAGRLRPRAWSDVAVRMP